MSERGAHGQIANLPLAPGTGSAEFRRAWSDFLLPHLDAFRPEILIVSAGFDAHRADPLAQLRLETEDYAWITGELVALAGRHAERRVVSSLEGGYDLAALGECVAAHVRVLETAV
jgi:acetoin utilization deacetylase AcuC-like enzyme